jgi:hypothetical protein
MSRLPRRASVAIVPERAVTDQKPAIRARNGPYFQDRYPPSVPIFTGVPARPLRLSGIAFTKFDSSSRDAAVE